MADITRRMQELQNKMMACGTDMSCMQPYIDEVQRLALRAGELSMQQQVDQQAVEETRKPLPAALEQLNKQALRVYMELDPVTQCEEINRGAEQIMKKIRGRVSPEIDGAYLPIRFCRETEVVMTDSGHGRDHGTFDIRYEVETRLKAAWTDNYLVRVGGGSANFLGFALDCEDAEASKGGVQVKKATGYIPVFTGRALASGPPDRWNVIQGGHLAVAPSSLKEIGDPFDPTTWPDSTDAGYMVGPVMPLVLFQSSQGTSVPDEGWPVPCMKNLANTQYLEPEQLYASIQAGQLRLVLEGQSADPFCVRDTTVISVGAPPVDCGSVVEAPGGAVVLDGDCLDHGGMVLASENSVFVNGRAVARIGDRAICQQHGITRLVRQGSSSVHSTSMPVARIGDVTECGAKVVGGSQDTFVGGTH
jgi:uncharacterized Zn-binding protein involved in type VI secretion